MHRFGCQRTTLRLDRCSIASCNQLIVQQLPRCLRKLLLELTFAPTTGSSNDSNWRPFIETSKYSMPSSPTTMATPANNFAHPPLEPANKYATLSELFSSQNTMQDHRPCIFGNTINGGHRTSFSINTNLIFGNAPFSSAASPSANANQKFPVQRPPSSFPTAPFPSNSNLFSQQVICSNPSNLFPMSPVMQPYPFIIIAEQPSVAQRFPDHFGKRRANSTNPFI